MRIEELIGMIKSAPAIQPENEVFLPGEFEYRGNKSVATGYGLRRHLAIYYQSVQQVID